jgi:hypothetical protein
MTKDRKAIRRMVTLRRERGHLASLDRSAAATASTARSGPPWPTTLHGTRLGRLTDEAPMQFLCEDMDLAGQLGVGFELEFLSYKVVVGFGLLEGRLAILADHDERRQEDRFK